LWLEWFAKRAADKVAKRTKKAFLKIPFYRRKLRENNIPFNVVRSITSFVKLENFLNKYRNVEWISEDEMIKMSDDYCLPLSFVAPEERCWVQASSGYTLSEKMVLNSEKDLHITRKRVAYTKKDLETASKIFEGLVEILPNGSSLAIFGRLGDLCGSGTYPFLAISGNYTKLKVKTLYFGIPQNEDEAYQWLRECESLRISGMIGIPSTLERLTSVAKFHNLHFTNLKLVGTGGHKLSKKLVEQLCQFGAKVITIGYGAQEIAPLANVAFGNVYSEISSFPPMGGMGVLGTLYYLRITDKNGETVSDGENGFIRVTSPFDGTTLIDYNTNDLGKIIERKYAVWWKGKSVTLPFPLLDYDINRSQENALRVLERNVYTKDITELCCSFVGYRFLIGVKNNNLLYIYVDDPDKVENLRERLANFLPSDILKNTRVEAIPKQILQKYLHPKDIINPIIFYLLTFFFSLKMR
jgi:phenylacetate-coenzyme A ligase PaaK-like adenylate-forming protein